MHLDLFCVGQYWWCSQSTVKVQEHAFSNQKITGGVGFKLLQKMGWSGNALGKGGHGILEPIAITMNLGTRGLCGADESAPAKKKKKKKKRTDQSDPASQLPNLSSNNPNYTYVQCRFDPNHVVPSHRLLKHELKCPANPYPASAKAREKRKNLLDNNSSKAAWRTTQPQSLPYGEPRASIPSHQALYMPRITQPIVSLAHESQLERERQTAYQVLRNAPQNDIRPLGFSYGHTLPGGTAPYILWPPPPSSFK